jgi:hypothetical protein
MPLDAADVAELVRRMRDRLTDDDTHPALLSALDQLAERLFDELFARIIAAAFVLRRVR